MRIKASLAPASHRPDAVLFDIGMTIIFPDGRVLAREFNKLSPGWTVNPLDAARALAASAEVHHFGFSDPDEAVGVAMAAHLNVHRELGVAAWRAAICAGDLYSEIDPFAKIVLQELRRKGIKTAAVSNASNDLKEELASYDLLSLFDVAIGSNDGYAEKPHRAMFDAAVDAIGVDPASAWHVGDGLINDVLGSSQAGIGHQILVDRYGVYTAPPCKVVESMEDLNCMIAQL